VPEEEQAVGVDTVSQERDGILNTFLLKYSVIKTWSQCRSEIEKVVTGKMFAGYLSDLQTCVCVK